MQLLWHAAIGLALVVAALPRSHAQAQLLNGDPGQPIDKDLLPASWKAARDDGSKFELRLTDDGNFTWTFSPPKQKGEEFGGTYTTDGPVLILQRKEGGALAGVVTFDGEKKFNFRMVGAPPEDKGLDFSR